MTLHFTQERRRANPAILNKMSRIINKLSYARDEYAQETLPTALVEAYIRQAKHILQSLENDLHLNK